MTDSNTATGAKSPVIIRQCGFCSNDFTFVAFPSQVNRNRGQFCSKECCISGKIARKRADMVLIECPDGAQLIPLTKSCWAIVDDSDYKDVRLRTWRVSICGSCRYAVTDGGRLSLHVFLMGKSDGKLI